MDRYTANEVMDLLVDEELDSGDDSEINEDSDFPMPHGSGDDSDMETDIHVYAEQTTRGKNLQVLFTMHTLFK